MARTPRTPSSLIDTPAKRAKLAPRRNPYWSSVAGGRGGVSLGYRKVEKGPGAWVAKLALSGKRLEERLGTADDAGADADAFSFSQGVTRAMTWARERLSALEAQEEDGRSGDPTVGTAIETYIAARLARSKRRGDDAASRLRLHALSDKTFAATPLRRLTATAILKWRKGLGAASVAETEHEGVAAKTAKRRGRPAASVLAPASVNRLLNDVRAALNGAAELHRRELPGHVAAEIKVGTRAIADATETRHQILTDADVRAVVDAAFSIDPHGDFGRLVLLLAATGARFSQIAKATVADVQAQSGRIMVTPAQKGRSARIKPKIAVPIGEDVLERLTPVLNGRKGHEPLLERWRHKQVAPTKWEPVARGAWTSAAEMTRPWKSALRVAGVPEDTDPYALRHSSIVRALRANVPVRIVAALHDTSTAMIEKHYSSHILDVTEELARRALVPLAPLAAAKLKVVS